MTRQPGHKPVFGQPLLVVLLALGALLVGQGVSAQHMATYGGHLHTYIDHAKNDHQTGGAPVDQQDQNRLCDLAAFAHSTYAPVDDAPVPQLFLVAVVTDAVAYQAHHVSTYRHLRPPSRAPPLKSKA